MGNDGQPNLLYVNNHTATPYSGAPQSIGDEIICYNGSAGQMIAESNNTTAVAVADVNSDGRLDVVLGGENLVPYLYLGNGNSAQPFENASPLPILRETELAMEIDECTILESSAFGISVVAEATSTLTVGSGATIVASEDVTIDADATSYVNNTALGMYLGVSYGSSAPTAKVTVMDGATINADTQNTLYLVSYMFSMQISKAPPLNP